MPSLLITIFVIQLLIHLINTIGASTINDVLWQLYTRLPLPSSRDLQAQIRLRSEVVRLKREMGAISAQDDFARWAKLRRQHDKALEEHDKKASSLSSARSAFDSRANITRWVLTSGVRLLLQFWHARTPVFTFPRGWVPWYVEWMLAFPRAPSGSVSVNVWSAACAAMLTVLGDVVGYLVVLVQGQGAKRERVKVGTAADGKMGSSTTAARGSKKEL